MSLNGTIQELQIQNETIKLRFSFLFASNGKWERNSFFFKENVKHGTQ